MGKNYDYLVIGSGPAGHMSAIKASQLGLKVAIVEKSLDTVGGVCLNEGCIPAKALYHSAKIFDAVKKSSDVCGCEVKFSNICMSRLVEKSIQAKEQLRKGLLFLFKKNNIDLIEGKAQFIDNQTVRVAGKDLKTNDVKADKFLIATGSRPKSLEGIPFDGKRVIASSHAIRLNEHPRKMLIIGGGAIGTEFASFFNIIGSQVSLVEMEETVLPGWDKEISRGLESIFKRKGVRLFTSSRVKNVSVEADRVNVLIENKDGQHQEECEILLVAIGRMPSTKTINLESAGVKIDKKGFIQVDTCMRTNVKNIYAAGDCLNTPMLAHTAFIEGETSAFSASGRDSEAIDYTCIPNAVYTEVQAASVGVSEEEAKKSGVEYQIGKAFFKANGMAVANFESEGFIKIIADGKTNKLLGAHIIGYEATELIHEFVLAKKTGLTINQIRDTVHAHPTFSEAVTEVCRAILG